MAESKEDIKAENGTEKAVSPIDQVREKLNSLEFEVLVSYFEAKCKEKLEKKQGEWAFTQKQSVEQACIDQLEDLQKSHIMIKAEPQVIEYFQKLKKARLESTEHSENTEMDIAIRMINSISI